MFCLFRDLNPEPLNWQSSTLTTRPPRTHYAPREEEEKSKSIEVIQQSMALRRNADDKLFRNKQTVRKSWKLMPRHLVAYVGTRTECASTMTKPWPRPWWSMQCRWRLKPRNRVLGDSQPGSYHYLKTVERFVPLPKFDFFLRPFYRRAKWKTAGAQTQPYLYLYNALILTQLQRFKRRYTLDQIKALHRWMCTFS